MSLIRWKATNDPYTSLQAAMNDLLEDFGRSPSRWTGNGGTEVGAYVPSIDVSEDEKEIHVTAELPGLDDKDIQLSVEGDLLTLKGEKKQEKEEKGKTWYACERTWGSFRRTLQLPCEIDMEKSAATFRKGVLSVTLPKSSHAAPKGRTIAIKAG